MNHHDVGRGRGGVGAGALARCGRDVTVAGIASDRLYPLGLQEELARLPSRATRRCTVVESRLGHDGFLLEIEQVGHVVRSALEADADTAVAQPWGLMTEDGGVLGGVALRVQRGADDGPRVRHDVLGRAVERPSFFG